MDARQCARTLTELIDQFPIGSGRDLARALALYTLVWQRVRMDRDGHEVVGVSRAYVLNYSPTKLYRRFSRHFDQFHATFEANHLSPDEQRAVLRRLGREIVQLSGSTTVRDFQRVRTAFFAQVRTQLGQRRQTQLRANLLSKFRLAVKKYLRLTSDLGFQLPSEALSWLIRSHQFHAKVLTGQFSLVLLPLLPDAEASVRAEYERYRADPTAWAALKEMYYDRLPAWQTLAIEVKAAFREPLASFSDYFDDLYRRTYMGGLQSGTM